VKTNLTKSQERLILDLHTIGAIKFGGFKLKSGIISPYYFDLRLLVSYPYLLELVSDVFWEKLRILNFDVLVGVPYTAMPIATAIGLKHTQNMIFVRKEVKGYGTKKMIEGDYHKGQKAVVIDDVITNGESKLETISPLEKEGLVIEDIVVLIDRGQGGPQLLSKHGYKCHSIFTLEDIFKILLKFKRVDETTANKALSFMKKSRKQFLKSS
jgi:uridine monophosphate synthetase